MAQPVALYIPDTVVSEFAAIAAPSDAKAGVEQLRKLLDTKSFDPVAARIWAAQGWTLAHGRHMAAVSQGDKAGAKASAALEGAFLRLHNDLCGRGLLGRAFGSAKEPFIETLRLAAQRREERTATAAVETAAAVGEMAKALPGLTKLLERQADAAERQAVAVERQAVAAERQAVAVERTATAAERQAVAAEELKKLLDEGAEPLVEVCEAVTSASRAMSALAVVEAAKAKAEAPATP